MDDPVQKLFRLVRWIFYIVVKLMSFRRQALHSSMWSSDKFPSWFNLRNLRKRVGESWPVS